MPVSNSNPLLNLATPPERVISLVPSITESIFDLGLGDKLVGITDYCCEPADKLEGLPRVGGVMDPDLAKITALNPELVISSKGENSREIIEEIQSAGIPVWVTNPRTIEDALDILNSIAGVFRDDPASMKVNILKTAIEYALMALTDNPRIKYFCPIWQEEFEGELYWITFNDETYAGNLMHRCGGENIFSSRKRKYPLVVDLGKSYQEEDPGERDVDYPRVISKEIVEAQPDLIIFPDEPYPFTEQCMNLCLEKLHETPAVKNDRFKQVEGKMITWFGTRTAKAVLEIPGFLS